LGLIQRHFNRTPDVACSRIRFGGDVSSARLAPAKDAAGKVGDRSPATGSSAVNAQDKLHAESPSSQEYQSNTIMRSVLAFPPDSPFGSCEIR
jgi:hypothetical protein